MLFNSFTFAIFFVVVLVFHNLPVSWQLKKLGLLVASWLFYAAWNPPFVVLLWVSTGVDWFCARALGRADAPRKRKWLLAISIAANMGLLGYFKYGAFLTESVSTAVAWLGFDLPPTRPSIILPVGISFYTFQTLSYTADVYRGNIRPWPRFLDYALYVSFFPQLVAGPIVRAGRFLPQCVDEKRTTRNGLSWGLSLLVLGLFEKVVLADALLAPVVDQVYGSGDPTTFVESWTGTLAFAGQLFCDFAGYSTCAIGAAACLGFSLPRNFRFPFAAIGFSDFWQRWHISLSSWLRDYIYIPLGGSRRGRGRTYVNALVTMLLGGLWHGASWTFVAWGAALGFLVALEGALHRLIPIEVARQPAWIQLGLALLTFGALCPTFTLFRSGGFGQARTMLASMGGIVSASAVSVLSAREVTTVVAITAVILSCHWVMRHSTLESLAGRTPWWARSVALAAMILALLAIPVENRAFVYFQF